MTLQEMSQWVANRLDDNPSGPVYYSQPQITSALNEAQLMFVLLTLCLEKTVTWQLPGKLPFVHVLCQLPDWLMVKRIQLNGKTLRPSRLSELDALDSYWQSRSGVTTRYAAIGFDLLAFYPQPALATDFQVTYYNVPPLMVGSTDVPAIQEVYHPSLVDYAEYVCRQGEGGDEFSKTLARLDSFFEEATKAQQYYKAPNIDSRYETRPFQLTRQDRSRLTKWRPTLGKTEPLQTENQNT